MKMYLENIMNYDRNKIFLRYFIVVVMFLLFVSCSQGYYVTINNDTCEFFKIIIDGYPHHSLGKAEVARIWVKNGSHKLHLRFCCQDEVVNVYGAIHPKKNNIQVIRKDSVFFLRYNDDWL